jgi:hypothetical protein
MRRTIELTGDSALEAIEQEVLSYSNMAGRPAVTDTGEADDPPLLVPFTFSAGDAELSLFTTLTMFGTPRDVTLEELCVELFFPADDATEKVLRGV